MTSNRPKELPFESQNAYALLVYGVRLIYQLWPFWILYFCTNTIDRLWLSLVPAIFHTTPADAFALIPLVHITFALALMPITYILKKLYLASWVTVDAAAAGLIITTLATTWRSLRGLDFSNFHWAQILSGNYAQAFILLTLSVILVSLAYKGSPSHWLTDLITPTPQPEADTSPTIKGTIIAPQSAQLRDIDPVQFSAILKKRVIGQDLIANQLGKAVARRMAMQRRGKPVFTGLFAGPTGVGKTEMAKAVAGALLGNEKTLFRVDCGNVLGEAGLQTLIGAPTGYMGSDKPGTLTAHVQRFPHSVLLFDEIEKAMGQQGQQSPLLRLLLSLLDEGRFTEQSTGATIDATGCVIIMTSNAAHKALGAIYEQHKADPTALTRATKDELQSYFAPEFLARIDLVTSFSPLDTTARSKVLAQHIARIAKQYDITVGTINAELINQGLAQWQALENYGAREVLRWLEDAISDTLITAKKSGLKTVDLEWKNGAFVALGATK